MIVLDPTLLLPEVSPSKNTQKRREQRHPEGYILDPVRLSMILRLRSPLPAEE